MKNFFVTLLPQNVTVSAKAGENLLSLLQNHGFAVKAPCGGNGKCGKCRVTVNGEGKSACKVTVDRDLTVILPDAAEEAAAPEFLENLPADGREDMVLAIDLGTTTVAGYLLDGKTGHCVASCGLPNPQQSYGGDVISRIHYALRTGDSRLTQVITDTLNTLAVQLSAKAAVTPERITSICLAANPAMHHLALGIDPRPLTVPPYMPGVFHSLVLEAGWLSACPKGKVRVLPNIAGFVGGDTVACMVATAMDTAEEVTLLLDIGTNGELVLCTPKGRVACSCAAGPALEGAGISRGMSATKGAVDRVWLENGRVCSHTVEESAAAGICGTGILDLIAVLLELGIVDSTGYMSEKEYILPGTDIALSRQDIRQVQLAKSAIRTGIELLCEEMNIAVADIQKVLLAGAFGSHVRSTSVCRLGLLPPVLRERTVAVGNAAGVGAAMCALKEEAFAKAGQIAKQTRFLELASAPDFQDRYVENLNFEATAV